MTLSCRKDQYSRLDTLNVKIRPLFQNLLAFLMEAKKWEKSEESRNGTRRNLIHIEEDILTLHDNVLLYDSAIYMTVEDCP